MSRTVYRVYYDERAWPNKGDSLASRKNDREIAAAPENFPSDLRVKLSGRPADVLVAPKDRTTLPNVFRETCSLASRSAAWQARVLMHAREWIIGVDSLARRREDQRRVQT